MEMEHVYMSWSVSQDSLNNILRMEGKIDESLFSMGAILDETTRQIDIALKYEAKFLVGDEAKYPEAEKGKIVVQYTIIFPSKENLQKFLEEAE